MSKKKFKFKGDTPLGLLLQKRADRKKEQEEIEAYINLNLENLTDEQKRVRLTEHAEKYHSDFDQ